jgi:hypothetical protein
MNERFHSTRPVKGIAVLVAALVLAPWPVHAYIDPGAGGLLLQLLIGGGAAAAVAMRRYWRRVFGWFKRER